MSRILINLKNYLFSYHTSYSNGAEGETRTPTNIRPLVPETSASTNSATSAL